jgi:hypothetical protein
MSTLEPAEHVPLESDVEVISALRLGWSVRAVLSGSDESWAVWDARDDDEEFQVLTLQGWRTPETCYGEAVEVKIDSRPIVQQESLFK